MHPVMQQARSFDELLDREQQDGPYAFGTIFDNRTWQARRRSKRKFRLLQLIDAKLQSMLLPGERVRYVTQGCGVSFWESYFLSRVVYYLNRRAIVITNRRVLLVQISLRDEPRELVAQLRYDAIARVGSTLLGNTKLQLGNGATHVFAYVPKEDRRLLQSLVKWTGLRGALDRVGLEDLCSHCYAVADGQPERCASCGGAFKSSLRAALLSLAFPGFGGWYLGHRTFALLEMMSAALVWVAVLRSKSSATTVGRLVMAGLVVLFLHGVDALTTRHIARKGLYPDRSPSRATLAR
jgi:hypothetical protein